MPAKNKTPQEEKLERLATNARAIASSLSYNEDKTQACAKHTLVEISYLLDELNIRAYEIKGRLIFIDGKSRSRYATTKELWLYKLFGVLPREI